MNILFGRLAAVLAIGFLVCVPVEVFPEEICYSQGDASKVLIELERCQSMEEGLAKCSSALDVSKEAAEYCESLRAELNERIVVLAKEGDEALGAAGEAGAAGKQGANLPWS